MLPEMLYCPQCGIRGYRVDAPICVRLRDVLLSVFFALVAVGITGFISYQMIADPFGGLRVPIFPWLTAAGLLNGYVIGVPITVLLAQWYTHIRRGEFLHTWLWQEYWKWQALVLTPVVLVVLFNGVGLLRDQYAL